MWTSPSTPGMISTKAPNATTLVTLPSRTSPCRYSSRTFRHGSSWVCFRPSEIRWRSRSMSSTLTRTVSPTERTSEGWLTWLQESSEMWISPSIPSRSTKAPKSTMLEILPSTTMPGWRRPRICSRTSLRSSSSTARRERTTLLRLRLSSITLHSSVWPLNSSRLWTRRMSTSEAGRKPAHAEVQDQAALDDLDHDALDRLAGLGRRLDLAPCLLEAGALLGQQQAPLLVLLGEHQGVDALAERDLLGRDPPSGGSRARSRG